VRVLGGDSVGELVQVRLAGVRIAGGLEQPNRLGGLARDVVGEERRAVRGGQPRGVEEILDGEPRAVAPRLQLGDPDPGRGAQIPLREGQSSAR
jgi:hypothetical protein